MKIIISGGGTGGHIYPAIAIANALKARFPGVDILFVGAEGRMEMEKVPAAGYPIVGLPVAGLQRTLTWKNLLLPYKLWKSVRKAAQIINRFKPDVVVGVGGYASAPVLWTAQRKNIPTVIQEQNSYAGVTNKLLARRASRICVAYEGMERFFPKEKITLTGNPVRYRPAADEQNRSPFTVLIVGGSLGARTLNQAMMRALPALQQSGVHFIWQTGKAYFAQAKAAVDALSGERLSESRSPFTVVDFIARMDEAFAAADVVVSRAGAGTISELCVAAKACVLVPSPNVAEDHQTKNAQALVNKKAAIMVRDDEANEKLFPTLLALLNDETRIRELERNIAALAKPNAANDIAGIIGEFIGERLKVNEEPPVAVYFIGIGGIGMSALARYYKLDGVQVAGYDRTPSPLTAELEREGIAIHYDDDVSLIPPAFTAAPERVLVIYTPAVPAGHSELNYFKNNRYTLVKRSQALGYIAATKTTLAVAGTHGKSTISTMLAHLLTQAAGGCTAFLGGISKNYHSNLLVSGASALVAEADEFDRSFLQLFPNIAVITATDADHLDIYGTAGEVKKAFADFAAQVRPGGALIVKMGVDFPFPVSRSPFPVYRYSLDQPCDFYAGNIRLLDSGLPKFDLHLRDTVLRDCVLGVPGRMNIENAVAAAAAAYLYITTYRSPFPACPERSEGVTRSPFPGIQVALATFAGVQRRFDVQLHTPACTYVDDYAHHPEELRAAITSLREAYPRRRITGVFQPHLYSRTRDFAAGFAKSLDLLDSLILLDIYPAREEPLPGVTSQIIFDRVTLKDKTMCRKDDLLALLDNTPVDVLATFGAGDIDRFVAPITALLHRRTHDTK
jgi:UDP-N-acetylmuramate--alanine ligase